MDMKIESNARKSRTWRRHIDAWQQSGSTQRDYCESQGIALSTFHWWRRRLLAGSPVNSIRGPECLELVAVPRTPQGSEPRSGGAAGIVLCVGDYRLELANDVHVQTLSRVIDVLESR